MRFPIRQLAFVTFVCGGAFILSCGEKKPVPLVNPEASPSKPEQENKASDLRSSDRVPEQDRSYQLDSEEIVKLHSNYTLSELPDYADDVWGAGDFPRDESRLAEWAFIVPKDRIGDFRNYLRELGVPEEYFERNSGVIRTRDIEDWRPPVPPATELKFLGASALKSSGKRFGLEFIAERSRVYWFDNLNMANGDVKIRFDDVSGNCTVLITRNRVY